MKLGDFELSSVSGGSFKLDGGAMFGIIPKPIWSKTTPCDEKNRILLETNCFVIKDGERTMLIETGVGSKHSDRFRQFHDIAAGNQLVENLKANGIQPTDIDTVILSHLHFDHSGGSTMHAEDGSLVPTFPNAEYVAQRHEWVMATSGYPELAGAYPPENLLPLEDAGQLRLIDGDVEIVPGIHAWVTGGHTEGHSAIIVESGDEVAVFLGDICPTTKHLPTLWGMAYDVDVLQLRRKKSEVFGKIADEDWIALFDHDPKVIASQLERDDKRDFVLFQPVEDF